MDTSAECSATINIDGDLREADRQPTLARSRLPGLLEALGVALSPAAAALVLRLRLMSPDAIADPSIHTIYIVAPRDHVTRFGGLLSESGMLREACRVGFLIPARLAYLAFGAVPGFFVTRYVFALIAVVPAYLLLRRLYGPPAGVAGILVILSCPVIITAWGTDYPDSAVVSYAIGGIACLAMPCSRRRRRAWLAAAGTLLVLAVWSHGIGVPLAGATIAAYLGVRLARDRAGLAGDLALLAATAAAVTGLLAAASGLLLGRFDFITPTWQAYQFLSTPAQTAIWHSAHKRWVLHDAYLLVPPAVIGAFTITAARRARAMPTPALLVGVIAAAQLAAYLYLQFADSVEALELHYFSAPLWSGTCVALAVTIAGLSRPLSGRPYARWLPAAVLLAVPLGYQASPHLPPFGWAPYGIILAAAAVAAAAAARASARLSPGTSATATGLALAALTSTLLALTVTPVTPGSGLSPDSFPAPAYSSALGSSGTIYIDGYRIATQLPGFVGPPAYPGEALLAWPLTPRSAHDYMIEADGMYCLVALGVVKPGLNRDSLEILEAVRPTQLLMLSTTAAPFRAAFRSFAAYRPVLTRAGQLRSGPLVLHVWIVRLGVYYHPPSRIR